MSAPVVSASYELVVRSYELDVYGHVNNAVYQSWFEEGREAVLRAGGVDYDHFPRVCGLYFVVARTEIDFRSAACRGDRVKVRSAIARIGEKSVTFRQTAEAPDGRVFAAATTVMCFAKDGRAEPVPGDFRARFGAAL